MLLTAEQLYRQARQKARMISHRNVRLMMLGERDDSGPSGMDLEQRFIIEAIERALSFPRPRRVL